MVDQISAKISHRQGHQDPNQGAETRRWTPSSPGVDFHHEKPMTPPLKPRESS